MKRNKQTPLTLALGSAIAATLAVAPASAAENPFAAQSLGGGYMVASNHSKSVEGKCGEGKCGAAMGMSEKDKAAMTKTKKAQGDAHKAEQGKTTAEKTKATEGKCGEGKCGAAMGMSEKDKAEMSKSREGKCGGSKASKANEGKCGGAKK